MNRDPSLQESSLNAPSSISTTADAGRTESITPATHPQFYKSKPMEFVGVTTPTLIFIGVERRDDFDKIALPLQDSGPQAHGHVLVKTKGNIGSETTVIFQHWLLSPTIEGYRAIDATIAAAKGAS